MDSVIVAVLQRYLAGDMPLDALQELLIDVIWAPDTEEGGPLHSLAVALDSRIAEFTSGHIAESDLVASLRRDAGLDPIVVSSTSAAEKRSAGWFGTAAETRIAVPA